VLAVDKLCLEHEVDERRGVDLFDFAEGPVVTHGPSLYRPRTRWFSLPGRFLPSYARWRACRLWVGVHRFDAHVVAL